MGHPNTIRFKYFDFSPIIQTKTNLRQRLYQDTCVTRSSGYTGEREESAKCCHVSLGSSRHFMRSCHLADDDALLGPYAWQHNAYEKYIWSSFSQWYPRILPMKGTFHPLWASLSLSHSFYLYKKLYKKLPFHHMRDFPYAISIILKMFFSPSSSRWSDYHTALMKLYA